MKTKIKIYIALSMILALCLPVRANGNVAAADSAYVDGNYAEAAALYSQIIEEKGISAPLLYNLGNAYYKMGDEGNAVLCLERARKLAPSDSKINNNLDYLRSRITDANVASLGGKKGNVETEQESFIEGVYRMIAVDTQSNSWAVFAVLAFILFLGGLALYIFTPNVLARKTGFFSALTFLAFTIIFLVFAHIAAAQYEKEEEAVLMAFTTELLENPESNSQPATSPLHGGTKVKILEVKNGADGTEWLKVKLNPENIGWVKKEGIEII
ncbi:MAG: tetratricopeptide repeat protein [Muribaculaceae bacterium]|nr:tetratricopeptide repeat protein [Muribaculaceae bacterium]